MVKMVATKDLQQKTILPSNVFDNDSLINENEIEQLWQEYWKPILFKDGKLNTSFLKRLLFIVYKLWNVLKKN